jgi:hypothetical protein
VKVEVAKKTLEKGRKSIFEVMNDVGYSDDKAFREVFKKITGLSPLDYRAKYKRVPFWYRIDGICPSFKIHFIEFIKIDVLNVDVFNYRVLNFPYTGCPGKVPATVLPFFNSNVPFTITYSIPAENSRPFSKVALSIIVSGSKIVISASAPNCILPLKRIIGAMPSNLAGSSVIFQ